MASTPIPVQATVRHFDAASRSGAVLFDDGAELAFDTAAFDRGGLRTLRVGQRVRLLVAGVGANATITAVTIVTLAFPPGATADAADLTSEPAADPPTSSP